MNIPQPFIIHETKYWQLNHRLNSALPGYLMLGARSNANALHELPDSALAELGPLLATTQRIVETLFKPKRLYIGRYGHEPGHSIHFHIVPIYDWVEDLFWQDERYRLLDTFSSATPASPTDGAELTLFVWREFCERPDPPKAPGMTVEQVICHLREAFL
ncbi:HIT family protein [Pseudomonas sp. ADAK2]|uniref:HIT family protein n=1 Tax=unclassified Pseudomonas TaxID=196821 RepID=UPI00146332BF|nr:MULTISPECIES: HIT family protein [unclassified Pseudomonas]QJI41235.1 HIT family protein [Pseudomonas sp. ADAK7]QJI47539.1 HIT family protein [Pseudomonas sp. ADAK2]